MNFQEVLQRFPGAKRNGSGYTARCPVHEPAGEAHNPSLSLKEGDGGRTLLHCHAGCRLDDICTAIGITPRDLFPERNGNPGKRVVATYQYRDEAGTVLYEKVRFEPKSFVQRKPDGRGGWEYQLEDVRRVLYRLPELLAANPNDWVFVCEGEKDVDNLAGIGLVATCNAEGAAKPGHRPKWREEYSTFLKGRKVCIIADKDDAGRAHAAAVAEALRGNAAQVAVVELPGEQVKDASDWLNAHDSVEPETLAARLVGLAEAAAEPAAGSEPEQAEPEAALEPWRPFPVDALPEPVRGFVTAVASATGTDPAFAALAALVVLAGCIGNRVAALVRGGWDEPAVLWGVLVGRSGTTKSPVLKLVTRALFDLYKAARAAHAEAVRAHAQEIEHYSVRLAAWKAEQRKGAGLSDPPEASPEPAEKRVIVSDITVEKLGVLLQQNPLGLLLVRDELAAWIGSFDRYAAGGKGSDCPAWLSMYDATPVVIDRKNHNGTIFCERAAVSVLGTIQPGTLARVFGAAEREAGLLGRVLLAYPPERPALWTDESLPDTTAAAWRDLLSALLAIEPGVNSDGDPRPRFMPLSDEAKPMWVEWHDHHARETADLDNDDLAAHFAKLKSACIRFALTLECVGVIIGGGGSACISLDSMSRAIQLAEWFKGEGRRLYGMLGESDENRERRRLVELIRRRGGIVTVRDLTRGLWRYRGDSGGARAALDALVQAGRARWTHTTGAKGGRPAERCELINGIDIDDTRCGTGESGGCVDVDVVDEAEPEPVAPAAEWGEV